MNTGDALTILSEAMADRNKLTPEREAEVGAAIMSLFGSALMDLSRIADALDKLATPPETIALGVDVDEWQEQQDKRDAREERHVAALERLADLVDQLVQTNRAVGQG